MQEVQKYIVLLLVLSVIAYLFPFFRDIYLMNRFGGEIPYFDKKKWELWTSIIVALQNVGAAVWLWVLAKTNGLSRMVWSLFGLAFGLIAVGIFYLVRLNEKRET